MTRPLSYATNSLSLSLCGWIDGSIQSTACCFLDTVESAPHPLHRWPTVLLVLLSCPSFPSSSRTPPLSLSPNSVRRRDLWARRVFSPALPRVRGKSSKIAESRKDRVGASEPIFGNDEERAGARPRARSRTPEYKRRERESGGIKKRRAPGDAPRPDTKE